MLIWLRQQILKNNPFLLPYLYEFITLIALKLPFKEKVLKDLGYVYRSLLRCLRAHLAVNTLLILLWKGFVKARTSG